MSSEEEERKERQERTRRVRVIAKKMGGEALLKSKQRE